MSLLLDALDRRGDPLVPVHNGSSRGAERFLQKTVCLLHSAVDTRRVSYDDVQETLAVLDLLLLDRHVDVNARNDDQDCPLHVALEYWSLCQKFKVILVLLLLDHGADVHAKDAEKNTPLHLAANESNENILPILLKLLLDHGADINARNDHGRTPWMEVLTDDVQTHQMMYKRGALLHAVDVDGENALHINAKIGCFRASLYFVSKGLDPTLPNLYGETALNLYDEDGLADHNTRDREKTAIVAAWTQYQHRLRRAHWKKNWPLLCALTGSGLYAMQAEMARLYRQQAASDKSVKIPGIPRGTKAQNLAYLNRAIFGRDNEHAILRLIIAFLPRERFEDQD
jgi:ankyrin repeat protein